MIQQTCGIIFAILAFLGMNAFAQNLSPAPYDIGSPTLTELWVDPVSGDDGNGGSSAADAVRTLNAAWRLIPVTPSGSGYRVNILSGNLPFDESCNNYFDNRHGSRSFPVIIAASRGRGTVIIEGGLNIANCQSLYLVDLGLSAGGTLPTFGNDVLHLENCTNVLLRGLTVTGPDHARYPDNYDIQEVIKANQCGYFYLEDSDVSGTYQTAVDLFSVQGGHVINSQIHGAGEWAMYLKGGSAYFLVHGNRMYDCGLGFRAGEGSNLEVMRVPWFHYECYDLKFINNVVHDINGVALSACGAYNFLAAYNTFVRIGTNAAEERDYRLVEFVHGSRGCVDTSENGEGNAAEICNALLDQGAWGTAVLNEEGEWIPNKNIYIFNNIFYNPAPARTYSAHFSVQAAITPPASTRNIPSPSRCDDKAVICGNLIWNGPADLSLGIENSTELIADVLRAENSINTIEPQLAGPAQNLFRPVAGGSVFSHSIFSIPAFAGGDSPYPPVVPSGNLTNEVMFDYDGQARTGQAFAGALAAASTQTVSVAALAPDFDGDAKADPALYYEVGGSWRIKISVANYAIVNLDGFLGGVGFSALAADFDGDRLADPAIYQETTGLWNIKLSSAGYLYDAAITFGGSGFSALAADFDGDRLADPAIYRETTGLWNIKLSSAGYLYDAAITFGGSGFSALAADYDGDRLADPAIYQETTGLWNIKLSSAGYLYDAAITCGGSGWQALAADYDGDGLADPAVFQSGEGNWIFKLSASGYEQIQLNDFPGGLLTP